MKSSPMESHAVLLPPPDLSSPSKKSQLKTPPHSTLKITNFSSINNSSNTNINTDTDTKQNGLLSPEFSSPNLFEQTTINMNTFNPTLSKDTFNPTNISIEILNNSPSSSTTSDKENLTSSNTQQPLEAPKFSKKRNNASDPSDPSDLSSPNSSSSNKRRKSMQNPSGFVLPNPHEMPDIHFPSSLKPPYSYASLIGMALLRSNERRLTLAEIYDWISSNFKYYKKGEVGWQNSIRHNLSLNKAFEKAEKSKDKKGHFWQIKPGYEHVYCNIKETKRNNNTNNNNTNNTKSTVPTTPKAESPETHNDVNDDKANTQQLINNILYTPKDNISHNHLLNHRNFNHVHQPTFSHSRNPSDGLGSVPELNVHYSSYNGSPISPNLNISLTSLPSSQPILDFTSSFSCQSNFELSPFKPIEQGPILEPLTPNRLNHPHHKIQLPPISKQLLSLQPSSSSSSSSYTSEISANKQTTSLKFKTPLKLTNTLVHHTNLHNNNTIPNLQSSSVSKRLYASPSYLDDFYTSPIQQSNSLNHYYRNNNSNTKSNNVFNNSIFLNTINGSPIPLSKRKLINRSSNNNNGYSTNEIFGIDIVTIHNHDD